MERMYGGGAGGVAAVSAALALALILLGWPQAALAQEATVESATQLLQEERYDEAARAFRSITQREPTNGLAWYRLGMALQEGGDQDGSMAPLERAAELGFQTPYARLRIARAHAAMGREGTALAVLEQALEEGLDNPMLLRHDDFAPLLDERRFDAVLDEVRVASNPCLHSAPYRAFDFWIGEWAVYNPAGQQIGESRIESLLNSCAILENWTDGYGNQGKSINMFDRATGRWRQLWVSDRGVVTDYSVGEVVNDGAMQFQATVMTPQGDTAFRRMVFTPVAADTVTQEIFQSADGESWTSAWLGVYVRQAEVGRAGAAAGESEGRDNDG